MGARGCLRGGSKSCGCSGHRVNVQQRVQRYQLCPSPHPPFPLHCPAHLQIETVATTLALAEQNNARELKRVCLEFVSKHLQPVMASEGYQYMVHTCPQLQAELLQVIATAPPQRSRQVHIVPHHQQTAAGGAGGAGGAARAADESSTDGQLRRVRQRRE